LSRYGLPRDINLSLKNSFLVEWFGRLKRPTERAEVLGRRNQGFQSADGGNRSILGRTERILMSSDDRILQGLKEALAHARGENVSRLKVHLGPKYDVAPISAPDGAMQVRGRGEP
jgi:hypothetical protein